MDIWFALSFLTLSMFSSASDNSTPEIKSVSPGIVTVQPFPENFLEGIWFPFSIDLKGGMRETPGANQYSLPNGQHPLTEYSYAKDHPEWLGRIPAENLSRWGQLAPLGNNRYEVTFAQPIITKVEVNFSNHIDLVAPSIIIELSPDEVLGLYRYRKILESGNVFVLMPKKAAFDYSAFLNEVRNTQFDEDRIKQLKPYDGRSWRPEDVVHYPSFLEGLNYNAFLNRLALSSSSEYPSLRSFAPLAISIDVDSILSGERLGFIGRALQISSVLGVDAENLPIVEASSLLTTLDFLVTRDLKYLEILGEEFNLLLNGLETVREIRDGNLFGRSNANDNKPKPPSGAPVVPLKPTSISSCDLSFTIDEK